LVDEKWNILTLYVVPLCIFLYVHLFFFFWSLDEKAMLVSGSSGQEFPVANITCKEDLFILAETELEVSRKKVELVVMCFHQNNRCGSFFRGFPVEGGDRYLPFLKSSNRRNVLVVDWLNAHMTIADIHS
jgi:hypothetical protein